MNKKKKTKKTPKISKKELFSYQSVFSLFWWVSKISFLTPRPKSAHPKNIIKIGVSQHGFLEKQICVTKRPFLDQKDPKPEIPIIIFWAFFFSFNNKNTQFCSNPYFYSVSANLKKENFQILN